MKADLINAAIVTLASAAIIYFILNFYGHDAAMARCLAVHDQDNCEHLSRVEGW